MKVYIEYKVEKDEYCIKQPNRREKDEADIFYASKMSEYIKKGILTQAMLLKEYENSGGALSKDEAKKIQLLKRKMLEHQNDLIKLDIKKRKTKADDKKIVIIRDKLADIFSELQDYQNFHESLFSHTAEVLARNYLALWWVTNSLYKKDKEGEWQKIFDKDSFDDNLDDYDNHVEEDGELNKALTKGAMLISLWLSSNINNEDDFKEALRIIDDEKSDQDTESDK